MLTAQIGKMSSMKDQVDDFDRDENCKITLTEMQNVKTTVMEVKETFNDSSWLDPD